MEQSITVDELRRFLEEENYYIPEEDLFILYSVLFQRPEAGAFLFGPAGVGKTDLAHKLGKILSAEIFYFQMFPGVKEDELLVRHVINEKGDPVAADGVLIEVAKYLRDNPDKKAIVILDEYDKASPSADNFLLDFLQNGRIRYAGRKYDVDLERLYVFITSNEFRPFSEPFLRRLPRVDLKPLSPEMIVKVLKNKYKIDNEELLRLAQFLYTVSLEAGLKKIFTVQELNQFIRACSVLKDKADINSLIYSYLVKDPEDYENFVEALKYYNPPSPQERKGNSSEDLSSIIEEKINVTEEDNLLQKTQEETTKAEEFIPKFPKIFSSVKVNKEFPTLSPTLVLKEEEEEKEEPMPTYYGIVNYSDKAYHSLSRFFVDMKRTVNEGDFDGVFSVIEYDENKYIVQNEVLDISQCNSSGLKNLCKFLERIEDKNSIWLARKDQFIPFDFREFAKILFDKIGSRSELPYEVVYLSEKDKQIRIKIYTYSSSSSYDPNEGNRRKLAMDVFVYVNDQDEIVHEIIAYHKDSGDKLYSYVSQLENSLKELLRDIKESRNNINTIKTISKKQFDLQREAENFLKEEMAKYDFRVLFDNVKCKVVEIDIQKLLKRIYNETKNRCSNPDAVREIEDIFSKFADKIYIVFERRKLDLEKALGIRDPNLSNPFVNQLSYFGMIPFVGDEKEYPNLNKYSFEMDVMSVEFLSQNLSELGSLRSALVKKEDIDIFRCESFYRLEDETHFYVSKEMYQKFIKEIIVPKFTQDEGAPLKFKADFFKRKIDSMVLSYEGMEHIVLYNVAKNLINKVIAQKFKGMLDKVLEQYRPGSSILNTARNGLVGLRN